MTGAAAISRLDSEVSTSKKVHAAVGGFSSSWVVALRPPALDRLLARDLPQFFAHVSLSQHGSWLPSEQAREAKATVFSVTKAGV